MTRYTYWYLQDGQEYVYTTTDYEKFILSIALLNYHGNVVTCIDTSYQGEED